jgi:phosphatidylglycerol:prolipoprotein diacylglycerol transferase
VLPVLRFVVAGTQVSCSSHALAVAVGIALGALVARRRAREPALVALAVPAAASAALLGARALFVALHGGRGVPATGGLASTGGIAAGLAATWLVARVCRRAPGPLLDAIVPAGLLALAVGRVGCFLAGCCWGRPTALPWGVVFPEVGPPPRHPLQLYSAAADLLVLACLPRRVRVPGLIACRGCAGFGLVRAALELLRDAGATDFLAAGVTLPEVFALALTAGALLMAGRLRRPSPIDYASRPEELPAWPTKNRSRR